MTRWTFDCESKNLDIEFSVWNNLNQEVQHLKIGMPNNVKFLVAIEPKGPNSKLG